MAGVPTKLRELLVEPLREISAHKCRARYESRAGRYLDPAVWTFKGRRFETDPCAVAFAAERLEKLVHSRPYEKRAQRNTCSGFPYLLWANLLQKTTSGLPRGCFEARAR